MPTLARLSFFLPPAQFGEFAHLYDRQLLPLLQPHSLVSGQSDDRPYVEGVFSRLFVVESPTALTRIQQALRLDPAWQQAMACLRERLGESFRYQLGIYSSPGTEGKTTHAGAGLRQGPWQTLSVADGLGSALTSVLLWDPLGKLWVGTWEGVSCFDGAAFTNYTPAHGLAGPRVRSLLKDRQGRLWVGTGGYLDGIGWGVSCFNGQEWITYTEADGLAGNWVSGLAEDREGRIWMATDQGVSCLEEGRFRTYTEADGLASRYAWSLLVDRQGTVWAGTWHGLSRFDGQRFERVPLPLGTPTCPTEKVFALLEDRQGVLWLGLSEGVGQWDGQSFTRLNNEGEGKYLVEDPQGQVWWGAYARGVRCWNQGEIRRYDTAHGLSNDQAVPLAVDGAGQVWVGTQGGGICRFEGHRFFTLTKQDGLADNGLYTLYEDAQGRLWVGTYQGTGYYDGQGFTALTLYTGRDQWRDLALAIRQDCQRRMWFVNFRGDILRWDGQEVETLHHSEGAHSHVHTSRAIAEDPEGRLWFANSEPGIRCFHDGQWQYLTVADGLVDEDVRTLSVDGQGHIWVVTGTGGVSCWDGTQFHTVTTGEGLGYAPGRVVKEDRQGRIWFATDGGGVSCYDGEKFTRYTMADGLVYDRVFAILEDPQGKMWFGTQGGGVSRFDGQVFQTLSTQDGLVNDVVQELVLTRKGEIWIATEGGISRYTPSTQAPQVQLNHVTAGRSHAPTGLVSVASTQTRISFEFQGRSFTSRPERLVYRYRLADHDAVWQVTGETQAVYLYLPMGEYTFEVQAVDADLNYSEPATVQIEVVPDPELEALQSTVSSMASRGRLVGRSRVMAKVVEHIRQVAETDLTVLILGETGTGKGLAARHIHEWSRRRGTPFISVNCGAIPRGLEESELFGHEKGAFTGADRLRMGKVELAKGGTLFLDEVGDLPLSVQVLLLHLVQEHTFERVGGEGRLQAPARIIAATNRDLLAMVRKGTFREDLFYRLNVYQVNLPPLRERKEDIPDLAAQFIEPIAGHLAKQIRPLSARILKMLDGYHWPGNVRELEHVMERAVLLCQGHEIRPADVILGGYLGHIAELPHHRYSGHEDDEDVDEDTDTGNGQVYLLEEVERRHIRKVLEETGWKIEGPKGAAKLIGLASSTLRSRMQKLGIRRG